MTQQTYGQPQLDHDEIALCAYQLYEARGCEHGHDLEDWLAAERRLVEELSAATATEAQAEPASEPLAV